MLNEKLTIGTDEEAEGGPPRFGVSVEYEFLNKTSQSVTLAIGFPVPVDACDAAISPYMAFAEDGAGQPRTPFHVWVEDHEIHYATEAKAYGYSKSYPTSPREFGKEYTGLLRELGITPDSCNVDEGLPRSAKLNLASLGLIDPESFRALWTVQRRYYWSQAFPANKITHVRISYPSGVGSMPIYLGKERNDRVTRDDVASQRKEFRNTCAGADLRRKLVAEMPQPDGYIGMDWVDFILVTANYWNGPINDFALTIETPTPDYHVSFCWDGPIKQLDATHVLATARNFSPKRDLHIGFFRAS